MPALRYGIIGCGVIGPVHADAIRQLKEAQLVAVCDTVRESAIELAETYGARVYTHYKRMLAAEDIDAVCICTPHYLHARMSMSALTAGKHVFCEKPMAISARQLDAMQEAAQSSQRQLGICFQHRFDPATQHLRSLVLDGRFGQLLMAGAHCRCRRDAAYYNSGDWRGTWRYEGGGVLINQAIHTIDLLIWMLGNPISVCGVYDTLHWRDVIEVEDTAAAVISFESGAQGHIAVTSASNLDWDTRLQIFGVNGSAEITTGFPDAFTMLQLNDGGVAPCFDNEMPLASGKPCYGNSHIRALSMFTQSVLSGTPYPIGCEEARKSVDVILALYRSSRSGRAVRIG